uniref:Putative secreted protein n=1 Tax=Anopheles marajoara TaxID=58244 RepID=A0A2M4CEB4_9DIPT
MSRRTVKISRIKSIGATVWALFFPPVLANSTFEIPLPKTSGKVWDALVILGGKAQSLVVTAIHRKPVNKV